jgi:hypothetical protein
MSGMDHSALNARERRRDLLADRVLEGLGPAAEAELAELGDAATLAEESLDLEVAAARFDRAAVSPLTPMPADVADRVRMALAGHAASGDGVAGRIVPADASSSAATSGRWGTLLRAAGGFAAAAAIVLVAITALRDQVQPVEPTTPTAARAALVSRATDLVSLRWQGTDHPDIREARDKGLVSGEVIWSDAESEGFVRVCHLGINDPATGSYRLWVWNADDPDGPPVACATFDVVQSADFTVVPMTPAATVDRPVRASVTLVPAGKSVQRPDPADELLVASYRPGQLRLDDLGLDSPAPRPGTTSRG